MGRHCITMYLNLLPHLSSLPRFLSKGLLRARGSSSLSLTLPRPIPGPQLTYRHSGSPNGHLAASKPEGQTEVHRSVTPHLGISSVDKKGRLSIQFLRIGLALGLKSRFQKDDLKIVRLFLDFLWERSETFIRAAACRIRSA